MLVFRNNDSIAQWTKALLAVGNNTERGGESVLSSNLTNLPYLYFELFLHISTIK